MTGSGLARALAIRGIPRKAFAIDMGIRDSTLANWLRAPRLPKRTRLAIAYLLDNGPEPRRLTRDDLIRCWRGSQEDLAFDLGVSEKMVSEILNGHTQITTRLSLTMRQVLHIRGVSP